MKTNFKKYVKIIPVIFCLICLGIVIYFNSNKEKINYDYALLLTPVNNKVPVDSRIVFLDNNGKVTNEKKIGSHEVTRFAKDNNKFYIMPTDKNEILTLDTDINKLSKNKQKTDCKGRVEKIFNTKNGLAYIINQGRKDEDNYNYSIYNEGKCYNVPLFASHYYYDEAKNILGITGSSNANHDTKSSTYEYKYYTLDLNKKELKKINITDKNDFMKACASTNDTGVINGNYFYTIESLYDDYDDVTYNYGKTVYLNKYNVNGYKRETQKEIGSIPWTGIGETDPLIERRLYVYTESLMLLNNLENKKFVYKAYDLDFNHIKTYDMSYKGTNPIPNETPKVVNNKMYFTGYQNDDFNIYIYDLDKGKYEKVIKADFKFSKSSNEIVTDFIVK